MTDFVYGNGDTVGYSDGDIATAGVATVANVDATTRLIVDSPIPKLPAGVKPTGPVEIDWDHPSTKGLTLAVLHHYPHDVNLVTGNLLAQQLSLADYTPSVRAEGKCMLIPFSNATDYLVGDVDGVTGSGARSSLSGVAHKGTHSTTPAIMHSSGTLGSTGLQWTLRMENGSTGKLLLICAGGNISGETVIDDDKFHVVGISYSAGDQINLTRAFVDGRKEATTSTASVVPATTKTPIKIAGNGSTSWGANALDSGYNPIFFTFMWDRALSDEEHESLGRDPYQFLKTSTPRINAPIVEAEVSDRLWIL